MGSREVGSAVEQILKNVDLASIQDERARERIRLLLNLIESLSAELRKAQAENQYLREQLQRRQGGGGKAGGKPGSSPDVALHWKRRFWDCPSIYCTGIVEA